MSETRCTCGHTHSEHGDYDRTLCCVCDCAAFALPVAPLGSTLRASLLLRRDAEPGTTQHARGFRDGLAHAVALLDALPQPATATGDDVTDEQCARAVAAYDNITVLGLSKLERMRAALAEATATGDCERCAETERDADALQGEIDALETWRDDVCKALAGGELGEALYPEMVLAAIAELRTTTEATATGGHGVVRYALNAAFNPNQNPNECGAVVMLSEGGTSAPCNLPPNHVGGCHFPPTSIPANATGSITDATGGHGVVSDDSLVTRDTNAPQDMELAYNRLKGQVIEAIAILKSGTAYEKAHVISILQDGL